METKHTAEKWRASAMFEGSKPVGWRVIAGGYQLAHCCTFGGVASLEETEANARMIAAAPALLIILLQAIEESGHTISGPTNHWAAEHGEPIWICQARAIIAEATTQGGQSKCH